MSPSSTLSRDRVRLGSLVGLTVLLSACAPSQGTGRPVPLSAFAGTWDVTARTEAGDTLHLTYIVAAGRDSSWKVEFPAPTPAIFPRIISVAGDSIVTRSGPYPSTLRPGVMVTTDGVFRIVNGRLMGRSIARYSVNTSDSVRVVVSEGVRR